MKKNLIYILVGVSVALLIANLIINLVNKKPPVEEKPETSTEVVDSLFNHSISKFNLDSTWVEVIAINSNQYDSLEQVYKIKLPSDLRPTIILQELKNDFMNFPVELISDEKIVNGYTTLNVFSNDYLKLQATFTIDTELERAHSKISFIITGFEESDEQTKLNLLHSVLPFSVLMLPSAQSDSLLEDIKEYKKTYSVLIDDGIEDEKYDLETDFSKTHLKESVRYITWNYPIADLFIIDNKSELFQSAIFNFVKDEFVSRDIILYSLSDFITLPKNLEEAKSLTNFYIESNVDKTGKIILVDARIFRELENELLSAKKRGTKFYSPNELININVKLGNKD